MSFAAMKSKRKNFEELEDKLKDKSGGREKDERFWYPERDKEGNGFAIIRFLPETNDDCDAWEKLYEHGYQGKVGWYIEPCATTLGKDCPMCAANSEIVQEHGGWDS